MLLPVLAVTVALVVQDQAPLRAAAHENAPKQAALTAGDWLEIRGEQKGYLQVYDHRRERPGYVRGAAVRTYAVEEAAAPKLGTLVEFLRDAPGEESLGIGYVALFLKAAPAASVGPELFDALGTMAERLARRASARVAKAGDGPAAAQVEAAESYGVHFETFEQEGHTRVCYDGEAYRRVLAMGTGTGTSAGTATGNAASGPMRVRAAMGLTDPTCVDPALGAAAALERVKWSASVLEGIDLGTLGPEVTTYEQARLRLRRSVVESELSYFAARSGDAALAKQAGEAAKRELMLADRQVLADEDRLTYDEAAIHAATVRWAAEPAAASGASGALDVEVAAGAPGQTCIRVKKRAMPQAAPFEHCTYGVVWPSSLRVAPHDAGVAVVVQPLDGWSELLLLHPGGGSSGGAWTADTVTPATVDPDLGYVELAGFSPDGAHVAVVRESRASGPLGAPHTLAPWMQRTFQVLSTADLHVEKEASSLTNMVTFKRFQTADWRRGTLSLR